MEKSFNTIYDPQTMEPHSLFSDKGKLLLKELVSSSMDGGGKSKLETYKNLETAHKVWEKNKGNTNLLTTLKEKYYNSKRKQGIHHINKKHAKLIGKVARILEEKMNGFPLELEEVYKNWIKFLEEEKKEEKERIQLLTDLEVNYRKNKNIDKKLPFYEEHKILLEKVAKILYENVPTMQTELEQDYPEFNPKTHETTKGEHGMEKSEDTAVADTKTKKLLFEMKGQQYYEGDNVSFVTKLRGSGWNPAGTLVVEENGKIYIKTLIGNFELDTNEKIIIRPKEGNFFIEEVKKLDSDPNYCNKEDIANKNKEEFLEYFEKCGYYTYSIDYIEKKVMDYIRKHIKKTQDKEAKEKFLSVLLEKRLDLFVDFIIKDYIKIDFNDEFFLKHFKEAYSQRYSVKRYFIKQFGENLKNELVPKEIQAFHYLTKISAIIFPERYLSEEEINKIKNINVNIKKIINLNLTGDQLNKYKSDVTNYIDVDEINGRFTIIKKYIIENLTEIKLFDEDLIKYEKNLEIIKKLYTRIKDCNIDLDLYDITMKVGNQMFNIKELLDEGEDEGEGEGEDEGEDEDEDKDKSLSGSENKSEKFENERTTRIKRISEELQQEPETIFSKRFKQIKYTYGWGAHQSDKWPLRFYLKFEKIGSYYPTLNEIQDKIIIGFSDEDKDMSEALTQINSALGDNKFKNITELKQFIEDNIFYLSYNDLDRLYPDSTKKKT